MTNDRYTLYIIYINLINSNIIITASIDVTLEHMMNDIVIFIKFLHK